MASRSDMHEKRIFLALKKMIHVPDDDHLTKHRHDITLTTTEHKTSTINVNNVLLRLFLILLHRLIIRHQSYYAGTGSITLE